MTPEELLEKLTTYSLYLTFIPNKGESYPDACQRWFNDKVKLIQQAKEEWEKTAYGQGWIDGVKSIKNSKLNPI